jgi:hypothetical protein
MRKFHHVLQPRSFIRIAVSAPLANISQNARKLSKRERIKKYQFENDKMPTMPKE